MIQLLLSGILMVSATAGASPLLSLDQEFGHMTPETAFRLHCELSEDGITISGSRYEADQTLPIQGTLSISEQNQIQTLITEAANGPFQFSKNPCDIGTEIIVTSTYRLLDSRDCGRRLENLHPSAKKLIQWFRTTCTPRSLNR